MDDHIFEFLDLKAFLKKTTSMELVRDSLPGYLGEVYDQAMQHWEEGENEKALESLHTIDGYIEGFHVGQLVAMAIRLVEIDREEAMEWLNGISEDDLKQMHGEQGPNYSKGLFHLLRAALYYLNFDCDEAIADLSQVIKIDPTNHIAWLLRGVCYSIRRRHTMAIPDYLQALKGEEFRDLTKASLAYSYLRTGRYKRSYKLHMEILDKFPENSKVQFNAGISCIRVRKIRRGSALIDQAIALDPEDGGYRFARAILRMRKWRNALAEADLALAEGAAIPNAAGLRTINQQAIDGKISPRRANKEMKKLLKTRRTR